MPKLEPEVLESEALATQAINTSEAASSSVKLELEMEVGVSKSSGDYDEWFEIQKELVSYPSAEVAVNNKCKSGKSARGRANGEARLANEPSASCSELERDLLDDAESLDGLALYAQAQCPARTSSSERNSNPEEHDDITAQVQSAIDSILSLKKRPAGASTQPVQGAQGASSSDSSDKLLDQAVRSILGS